MDVLYYAAMQNRRRDLIARIEALTSEDRACVDGNDWSALALLEHMNIVDGLMLAAGEVKPGRGSRNPMLRLLISRSRRHKSMPAPRMLVPKGDRSFEDLVAESEANHAKLLSLVTRATEVDTITRHPFFGPLTATQACELLDSHYDYHLSRFAGNRV